MNERMYELINQCFICTSDGKLSQLNTVSNVEKFAELIVRECSKAVFERNPRFEPAPHIYIMKYFDVDIVVPEQHNS